MDGITRPPTQRRSSRKPIRRRFAPGSVGMGDSLDEFFCSAAESSRQCTHPAANSCRAGGRITSDNIPLSEPIPSVIGWIRLRCPARTAYLFAYSSAFAPKGVRFPPVSGHFHGGPTLPRCAINGLMQCSKQHRYSITSSAVCRNGSGMVRPSAFAVFRLMTSSYLVGCWTGRSLALAPLRIRST